MNGYKPGECKIAADAQPCDVGPKYGANEMPHENRKQVRVPQRLWDEMMIAIESCLELVEAAAPATERQRQVAGFARRVVDEARRRSLASEDPRPGAPS
jgi:hypothetical protein